MKVIDILKDINDGKKIPRFIIDDKFREYYMSDNGFLMKHNTSYKTAEYDIEVEWNIYREWLNKEIKIIGEEK